MGDVRVCADHVSVLGMHAGGRQNELDTMFYFGKTSCSTFEQLVETGACRATAFFWLVRHVLRFRVLEICVRTGAPLRSGKLVGPFTPTLAAIKSLSTILWFDQMQLK